MAKINIKNSIFDPYFDNVSLLLPFDSSFQDYSKNNFNVTVNGDTQISTAQSKFGTSSAYFDGNGDYLQTANSTDFGFGIEDFTIEMWLYKSSNIEYWNGFFCINRYDDNGILIRVQPSNDALHVGGQYYNWDAPTNFPLNQWNHFALVRSNGIIKIYINGDNIFSAVNSNNLGSSGYVTIGASSHAFNEGFDGYIDELRITKGIARYTSNFTPPKALLSNGKLNIKKVIEGSQVSSLSGLSLWLKADAGVTMGGGNVNTWADQSPNGNNATGPATKKPNYVSNGINGKPTMSFNGTTQLFTINDSNSLDITNCSIYVVLKRNGNGTGNEFVLVKNPNNSIDAPVYYHLAKVGGSNSRFIVYASNGYSSNVDTQIDLGDGVPRIMSFIYNGSTNDSYVNGIKTNFTGGYGNIITSTGSLQIGGSDQSLSGAQWYFNGYISELIIFNRALNDDENLSVTNYLNSKYNIYSSSYMQNGKLRIKTPSPFLIDGLFAFWNLNESSGTRYDSSGNGRNLTETYGTVSSTTGKIANCAYFNGTSGGGSTNSKLGSTSFGVNNNNDFSMSVWMKPRSFSAYQHIIGAPFQNGFYIGGNGSNLTFNLFNGTAWGISAPSTAFDTWHHYVFIREGSSLKLYADNTYIGSTSIAGLSFTNAPVFSVGGGEYNEYYFNGDIDALGLWTRVLTKSEIASLYNGGNGLEY